MYVLHDLAKMTHDEKLQAAVRDRLRGRAYPARQPENRGNLVPRLSDLRVLRGRRAARAYL